MIRKLKTKFIIVAFASVTIVLMIFISIINIKNYLTITNNADMTLKIIEDNNGIFPRIPPSHRPGNHNPEAPFDTRYFTIQLDRDGNIISTNIEMIAAINEQTAIEYAKEVLQSNKTKGFLKDYRYLISTNEDFMMIIFIDVHRDLNMFNDFLITSLLISLGGLFVFFILIFIFAGIITKPVVESDRKQKQFITDAGHELKTPLTIIGASTDILGFTSGENEYTKSIKEQVKRLSDLTNRLVYLARMEEEKGKTIMTDFSLSEVIEDGIKKYIPLLQNEGKKLTHNIASNLTLHGDLSSIDTMLSLLLDNALKYSTADYPINITLTKSGKTNILTITNSTIGIEKGNLDILFERFYRLDSSRNNETGGHGIGLSVVKAIVELHKGKITASSPDGKTIIFTVIL